MAERLPKFLQHYINIIDEFHYNPASKHYIRSGTIDSKGVFYIKSFSSEGHRMMFVHRKALFSSPLFFLQTFIHKGTHAALDQKAFNDYRDAQRIKAVLTRLQASGKGNSPEPKSSDSNWRLSKTIRIAGIAALRPKLAAFRISPSNVRRQKMKLKQLSSSEVRRMS